MDITNFDKLRVGSHYPQTLDIRPVEGHESYGICATFCAYDVPEGLKRAELRYKDHTYGLFLLRYEDQELPGWWEDSEVVWRLENAEM
jgi:hypothetical protein